MTLLAEFELIPVIEQLGEMELVGVGDSVSPTPTEKASGSLEIGASSAIGDSPTEEYPIPTENASESLEVGASSTIGDSPTEEYPIPTENASESLDVGASSAIGDSPTEPSFSPPLLLYLSTLLLPLLLSQPLFLQLLPAAQCS